MMFHSMRGLGDDTTDTQDPIPYDSGPSTTSGGSLVLPGLDSSGGYTDPSGTYWPASTVQASGTFYDPISGDTVDSKTGAIISGPLLGSSTITPSGNASTGFDWGIFGSLFSTAAADVTKIFTQQSTTQQAQAQSAAQIAAAQAAAASGSSTSNLVMYGMLAVGVLTLVVMMKKGH